MRILQQGKPFHDGLINDLSSSIQVTLEFHLSVVRVSDLVGAILISIYIIISWVIQATRTTSREWLIEGYSPCLLVHIRHLTGVTAEPDFLKVITWMAMNFSSHVTKIDMVKAFHFGTDLLVEGNCCFDHVKASPCHF